MVYVMINVFKSIDGRSLASAKDRGCCIFFYIEAIKTLEWLVKQNKKKYIYILMLLFFFLLVLYSYASSTMAITIFVEDYG